MRLLSSSWLSELAAIGTSFIDVLKAELAALSGDLTASGKALVRALLILIAAIVMASWVVVLLSLALIAYLEIHMQHWQAILLVAGLLLAVALGLFLWGRSTLQKFTPPNKLVQTHVAGHVEWLQDQMKPASELEEDTRDAPDRA